VRLYKGKHNHNSEKSVNYFTTNMKDAIDVHLSQEMDHVFLSSVEEYGLMI
jgi:hypothetical protein